MSETPKRGMDRVSGFVVAALLGLALLMGWKEVEAGRRLPDDSPAPDFTLQRYEGGAVTLSQLQGQVVLVDFWATWCPPCRKEMPSLVRLAKRYESRGVRLLALSNDDLDEQREAVERFVGGMPDVAPYVVYGTPPVSSSYFVSVLPTLYVIDRQGRIASSATGQASETQLERWIEAALAR